MCFHCLVCDRAISSHLGSSSSSSIPSSRRLLADLSGVLVNSHTSLDYPRLKPDTFVDVGGMQIPRQPGKLPKVSLEKCHK